MSFSSKQAKQGAIAVVVAALAFGARYIHRARCEEEKKNRKEAELKKRIEENVYETKKSVDEYILMHYGGQAELCPYDFGPHAALNFPFRCAKQCIDIAKTEQALSEKTKVLDLGCSVGGATFHLAKYFESVVGLDFSYAFIKVANEIKESGNRDYKYTTEGNLQAESKFKIDASIDRSRCTYVQGDACDLDIKGIGGPFGIVLGANLVCRLPEPAKFLQSCKNLVIPGGYLVLPSPYTWLCQYTAKDKWIGGYYDEEGKAVTSFSGLHKHLDEHFTFLREQNMPFFIKETARKHQWSVSHCTVWKRKAE